MYHASPVSVPPAAFSTSSLNFCAFFSLLMAGSSRRLAFLGPSASLRLSSSIILNVSYYARVAAYMASMNFAAAFSENSASRYPHRHSMFADSECPDAPGVLTFSR